MGDDEKDHCNDRREDQEGAVSESFRSSYVLANQGAIGGALAYQGNDCAGESQVHQDRGGSLETKSKTELSIGSYAERADEKQSDEQADCLQRCLAEEEARE